MNAKPILFSTEMVQAILAGRKTQTRRIVKNQPNPELLVYPVLKNDWDGKQNYPLTLFFYDEKTKKKSVSVEYQIAPYQIGDILWVRESWSPNNDGSFDYKTDYPFTHPQGGWKPSIHMPKSACRIFLKVKNVRAERLQDISEEDSKKEGVKIIYDFGEYHHYLNYLHNPKKETCEKESAYTAIESFKTLWLKINGEKSWQQNPFVWVYEFETTEKPDNF